MRVQLIVTVETLITKATFWVAFETALIYCSWVVVAELFVLSKLGVSEEFMFVGKDFLVACTEITVTGQCDVRQHAVSKLTT